MNDEERRLHDWLDEELDRMATRGDRPTDPRRVFASDTDRALSETADELRRRNQHVADEPSAAFLNQLEQQLISNTTLAAPRSGVAHHELHLTHVSLPHLARTDWTNPSGWGYRFASFAILLAFAGGLIFAAARFTGREPNSPSTIPAQGVGSLETPTQEAADDPSNPEWRVSTAASELIATDEYAYADGLEAVGDIVVRAWQNPESSGLEGLSASDGSLLWTNDTQWIESPSNFPGAIANYAFQSDANNVYVASRLPTDPGQVLQMALHAIDVETGQNLWSREFDGGLASFSTGPSGLYARSFGDGLLRLDPSTGETIWQMEGDPEYRGSIAPYSGDDTLIVVDSYGTVQSINPETGELLWRVETGLPAMNFSIAEGRLASGKRVIAVRSAEQQPEEYEGQHFDTNKSTLLVVDRESGERLWTRTLNDPSKGQMQITGGVIYTTTSLVKYDVTNEAGEHVDTLFRNWLVAIDLETGAEIWSIESVPSWGMAFEIGENNLIMYRVYGVFFTVDLNERSVTCDAFNPTGATSDEDELRVEAEAYDGKTLYLSLENGEVLAVDPGNWTC